MVISIRREDEAIVVEQADDILTGRTPDGHLRVAFVCGARIVGAIELTADESQDLEGALGRMRERIQAPRKG